MTHVVYTQSATTLFGQAGQQNLTVRKVYGPDQIRYLRCQMCGTEFSERKHTALWHTEVREATAIAVDVHLAEGCSLKGTARLVQVDPSTEKPYPAYAGSRPGHQAQIGQASRRHGDTLHSRN